MRNHIVVIVRPKLRETASKPLKMEEKRGLLQFDKLSNNLINFVANEQIDPTKKAKATAKTIQVLEKFLPGGKSKLNKNKKQILTHYRVRETSARELRVKAGYVGDFDYKNSEAYDLITKCCRNGRQPNDNMVQVFVKMVVAEENHHFGMEKLKPARAVYRSKAALYKFIQENIDIFKESIAAGSYLSIE